MKQLSWYKLEQLGIRWGLKPQGCSRGEMVREILKAISNQNDPVAQLNVLVKKYSLGDKEYENKLRSMIARSIDEDAELVANLCQLDSSPADEASGLKKE